MEPRSFKLLFLIISMIFAVSVFATPFLSGYGALTHLDGTPGYLDHWNIWSSKDPWTCITYTIGDIFCHQEMGRSYLLNGSQMPVCVRDVGLVLGFLSAFAVLYVRNIIVPKNKAVIMFIIISLLLMLIDWLIQHFLLLNVSCTRLATGILAGAAVAVLIALCYDRSFAEI